MNINRKVAIELLTKMKRIRLTEEKIVERYIEWKMRCPTHLCIGQEAISAAVGVVLKKDDFVVSTHRSHGHYISKGGSLKKMIAEIYGKITGCSKGKGGSMHLIDKSVGFMGSTAIVGGTIPVGVGLGLSIKLKKTNQVSCCFFGDGAIEEGVFYESVNFAVLKKLPVLFVCENNFYSVYSPLKVRQPEGREIYKMVESIGCKSKKAYGNDVYKAYNIINEAVNEIRDQKGPYFLEFDTYRWREHCGTNYDNDLGYRAFEEFEEWVKNDPIHKFETKLLNNSILTIKKINEITNSINKEIEDAFNYAINSNFPTENTIYENIYSG